MTVQEDAKETYIGDGVYASFDGFMIRLRTETGGERDQVIYIEDVVWRRLLEFAQGVGGRFIP